MPGFNRESAGTSSKTGRFADPFSGVSRILMTNKIIASAAAAAFLFAGAASGFAQQNPHSEHAEHAEKKKGSGWKERDVFHEVMGGTFHPMEEGDFKPIRARAKEMAEKAEKWAKSTAPKEFDSPKIKETLAKLVAESKALADLVAANAGDEEIKGKLTALHDRFHEIVGQCKESADAHKKGDH